MSAPASRDPLHGVTLERLLTELVAEFGWDELGDRVPVRCFRFDPSIKSSLTFLRKTPWARARVEEIYVRWKARTTQPATAATKPPPTPPAASAEPAPAPNPLTPEEQMALFEKELKETDWGHQPC